MERLGGIFLPFLAITSAFHVQLFDNEGFEGLFFESRSVAECTPVPSYGHDKASSVKADECVMFYRDANCSQTWSMKVPAGDYYDLRQFQRVASRLDNNIKSFHPCTEQMGGYVTRVDLKSGVGAEAVTLLEHKDLCGCYNVPQYADGKITSLNNWGNCVKLWSERDCRGGSVEVVGGFGEDASDLSLVRFSGITKSISGCRDAEECVRLNATVVKFQIIGDPEQMASRMANPGTLQMSAKTVFRNNGSATVTQVYEAKRTLSEVFTITREKTMSTMSKVDVTRKTQTISESKLWGVFRLSYHMSEAYTYRSNTTNSTETEREEFRKEESREFAASQTLEIPRCSKYTVSSFINIQQNFPVRYEVWSHVSGTKGAKDMDAAELRTRIGGLEWIEDVDNFTILVKGYGHITADFGVDVVIDGEGEVLDDCMIAQP